MIQYPNINPIAFHLGPLSVHWYGLMYLFGFVACWSVLLLRLQKSPFPRGFTKEQLGDIVFYAVVGVILGGRIGYMVFYNLSDLLQSPLSLFKIWQGGMSFHGGLIGVFIVLWIYAIKNKQSLLDITDFIAPAIPLGLAAGRLGNFINGELWGRPTDVPWAMIFPSGGDVLRHPSQLYEFCLEGILLFSILWIFSKKSRPRGAVSGLFLIMYSIARFIVEFYREPDPQIGFVALGWLTKGQLLSIPMFLIGFALVFCSYVRVAKKCSST